MNIVKCTSTNNTSNRNGKAIKYIVVHYTAGTTSAPGTAKNTALYFARPGVGASADFIVDDTTIIQFNGDIKGRYSWHCGGGRQSSQGGAFFGQCTNSNSIGIEVCSTNKTKKVTQANDSNWYFTDAVIKQTVELVKYLMKEYNIDASHVIRHFDVTGKYCPGIIGWNAATGDESKWIEFKNKLSTQPEIKTVYYYATVTADVLNCRSTYSTAGSIVTTYPRDKYILITKECNGWGYTGDGWVHLNYIVPAEKVQNEEEEEMTQQQFNVMMDAWIADQVNKEPGPWSAPDREWAEKTGLILGDEQGRKMYKKFVTREEIAALLHRFADKMM